MFLSEGSIIIMGIGTTLIVAFILMMAVSSRKYEDMVQPLEEKEFPLHELYTFGFLVEKLVKINYNSKKNSIRKKECELWYGRNYALYYMQVYFAKRITISVLIFLCGFLLYGLTREIAVILLAVVMAVLLYLYFSEELSNKIKQRSERFMEDFPEMVSQLALLVNAGMILREAWRKIAESGNGELYDQMRQSVVDMENGLSEVEAYHAFSKRCILPEIKKFVSVLVQNISKGNSEFCEVLKAQSSEIWMHKQARAKQQGEKAASKLLIPSTLMFVGIIIMIIVPIFSNF